MLSEHEQIQAIYQKVYKSINITNIFLLIQKLYRIIIYSKSINK